MAKPLVPNDLWTVIEPLLPPERPRPKGGRPPLPHRAALTGILFVLKSGIPWEMLPREMGCGSGMTCWRRLRDWQAAGAWNRLHRVLLDRLGGAHAIDWSRPCVDSASLPAKRSHGRRTAGLVKSGGPHLLPTRESAHARLRRSYPRSRSAPTRSSSPLS